MQAVILNAGKSTRTRPLTSTRPKALLPIANRPILSHQLEALQGIVKEAIIIVNYKQEMIREKYGSSFGTIKLKFVEQPQQNGTGDALLQAKNHLKNKFLVLYGDDLYARSDLKRLAKTDWGLLVKRVKNIEAFGAVVVKNGFVHKIIEKPETPISDLANIGAYRLNKEIFQEQIRESVRGEYELTDYISLCAKKYKIKALAIKEDWIPIGYPWSILNANQYLLDKMKGQKVKGKVEKGVTLKGAVFIGKGTIVKSGTYIEGPAIIGENCVIGPHAYIRPHTSIANHCRIGKAEIADSILMHHVTAKHHCYLGHSVIGEYCTIGAGTGTGISRHDPKNIVSVVQGKKVDSGRRKLGVFLGDRVKTGVNCCIYPGCMISPESHTLPGEVVRKNIDA